MINWNDFEHIHVIKKLKQILHSWWSIDILFTDERGQLKGFDTNKVVFANPAVNFLIHKDATQGSLAELVSHTVNELRSSNQRFVFKKWDASILRQNCGAIVEWIGLTKMIDAIGQGNLILSGVGDSFTSDFYTSPSLL